MAVITMSEMDDFITVTTLELQRPNQVVAQSEYTAVPQIYDRNAGTWIGTINFRPFSQIDQREASGKLDAILARLEYALNVLQAPSNLWASDENFTARRTNDGLWRLNKATDKLKVGMHLSRVYIAPLMPRLVRVTEIIDPDAVPAIKVQPDHPAAVNSQITFNAGTNIWVRLSSDIPRGRRSGDFVDGRVIGVIEAIKDVN